MKKSIMGGRMAGWVAMAAAVGVTAAGTLESAGAEYKLTGENTTVKFVGSKKDGKHEGSFKKLAGSFSTDGDVTQGKLQVTIEVDSMVTDAPKLTSHLKAPDFFDAKRFPEAKFVSKTIKKTADGYQVSGDLTMHGVTRPLSFPAKIDLANGLTVSSQFVLDRHTWGISYGKDKVDAEVKMSIDAKVK
jgi:polyisoprenoid-binding protein YceI